MPQGDTPHLDHDQAAAQRRALRGAQAVVRAFYAADTEAARRGAHDVLHDLAGLCRSTGAATFGRDAGSRP